MRMYFLCMLPIASGCLDAAPREPAVRGRRIVSVRADPAEVRPGQAVSLEALVASPAGPDLAPDLTWSFCTTPRGLDETAAVSDPCARVAERPVARGGARIDTTVPSDACARFGPETPSGQQPALADASGGYYQPLRLALPDGDVAVFRLRLRCALPSAPLPIAQDFAARYRENRAPVIARVAVRQNDREVAREELDPNLPFALVIEAAPDAAERYLAYDPRRGTLAERTETLTASWYASAGTLDVGDDGQALRASFRPTGATTPFWIWLSLRDDRGGTRALALPIGPR